MRVTAFTKYGRAAASTRQRLLQFLPAFSEAGIEVNVQSLLDDDYVASLASGDAYSRVAIVKAYFDRLGTVIAGDLGDLVWVYAELFPYLPAAFERLLVRRKMPIVYDFDDAFFLPYDSHSSALARAFLGGKLDVLLQAACACTCGNAYLRDHAKRFCDTSIVIPTVVDTQVYRPAPHDRHDESPVIGWIGSPSTWRYVRPLLPLLRELTENGRARFKVVGAGPNASKDHFPGMELVDWSEATEVAEVQSMDIGIMPLPDEPWARGKSGYKLIQYMACGLPVVASPVGVNAAIVADGVSGFVAADMNEWRAELERLLGDANLRRKLGARGRERAVQSYSLEVHAPTLVQIFRQCADAG